MADAEFESRLYYRGDGGDPDMVSIVAGYEGKIEHFEQAAKSLAQAGNDVAVFEYCTDVFLSGDPAVLPRVIHGIGQASAELAAGHASWRGAGASLGVGVVWNAQKEFPAEVVRPGLYAAGGSNAARLIFGNPYLRKARDKFRANGYERDDLIETWQEIHKPPVTPLTIALGGLDVFVTRREVMNNVRRWQQDGLPVRAFTRPLRGHTGMIHWFNANILELQRIADIS
jgi:hypothetical protein